MQAGRVQECMVYFSGCDSLRKDSCSIKGYYFCPSPSGSFHFSETGKLGKGGNFLDFFRAPFIPKKKELKLAVWNPKEARATLREAFGILDGPCLKGPKET